MRLRHFIQWLAALVVGIAALAVLNNNVTIGKPSREVFLRRLKQVSAAATECVLANETEGNFYLLYMLRDCSKMTADPRVAQLVARSAVFRSDPYFELLVHPDAPFIQPPERYLRQLSPYLLWTLYAISRKQFALSTVERANMFAPGKYRTGKATHQLISLILYREYNGATPELDTLIRRLSERVAQEAALDFRVTDLYLQRIAFLLAAGQPDLVKPRWVERALDAQQSNGGWHYNWHGWSPTPYLFQFDEGPSSHATVQGLWLIDMLQYRYPEWVSANYR